MTTGQYSTARPPHSEQFCVLAVVDHVSGTALSPRRRTGGPDLHSLSPEVRANSLPRRKCNRLTVGDCRALDLGSGAPPRRDTTAALGLRTGGGGLFQFGLATGGEFGDHARREGMQRLPVIGVSHGLNHGGISVREVVSVVQGTSYVQ